MRPSPNPTPGDCAALVCSSASSRAKTTGYEREMWGGKSVCVRARAPVGIGTLFGEFVGETVHTHSRRGYAHACSCVHTHIGQLDLLALAAVRGAAFSNVYVCMYVCIYHSVCVCMYHTYVYTDTDTRTHTHTKSYIIHTYRTTTFTC